MAATARNDKEKLSRTDGAEGRRWENDSCKDAENERERERGQDQVTRRRCVVGERRHGAHLVRRCI